MPGALGGFCGTEGRDATGTAPVSSALVRHQCRSESQIWTADAHDIRPARTMTTQVSLPVARFLSTKEVFCQESIGA